MALLDSDAGRLLALTARAQVDAFAGREASAPPPPRRWRCARDRLGRRRRLAAVNARGAGAVGRARRGGRRAARAVRRAGGRARAAGAGRRRRARPRRRRRGADPDRARRRGGAARPAAGAARRGARPRLGDRRRRTLPGADRRRRRRPRRRRGRAGARARRARALSMPIEHGRTLLVLGRVRRRGRRRGAARASHTARWSCSRPPGRGCGRRRRARSWTRSGCGRRRRGG